MTRFLLSAAFALLSGLCPGVRTAHAQAPTAGATPADQFHRAARLFVAGDSAAAVRAAEAGLRQAPRDPQLQALLAEIRRTPPPQPPRNNGAQNRNQNRNPQGRPPRPPQQPPRQPPPQQQPTPRPNAGRPRTPQQPPRTPQPGTARPGQGQARQGQPRQGQGAPPTDATGTPARMTREEAEALLRALGADERRLLRTRTRLNLPRPVERDW